MASAIRKLSEIGRVIYWNGEQKTGGACELMHVVERPFLPAHNKNRYRMYSDAEIGDLLSEVWEAARLSLTGPANVFGLTFVDLLIREGFEGEESKK